MKPIRLLGAVATALSLGLAAIGCAPEQRPQTVFLTGDSTSWAAVLRSDYRQTYSNVTGHQADTLSFYVGPGWTMGMAPAAQSDGTWLFMEQPADKVNDVTQAGTAATAIFAFGLNEAGDGWSASDEEPWVRAVRYMGTNQCLVLVKAAVANGMTDLRRQGIAGQRAFIDRLAPMHGGGKTVIVDLQTYVDAHPEYIDPDGIHDINDPAAYTARLTMFFDGVRRCDALAAA